MDDFYGKDVLFLPRTTLSISVFGILMIILEERYQVVAEPD